MKKTILSASILAADFAALGDECRRVLAAGCDQIHFDVMDHHYVPNLSFGAVVCQSLRNAGISAPIDVHLMVTQPENHFSAFAKAGASSITFHPDTVADVPTALAQVKQLNCEVGLAINPDQPLELITAHLNQLDSVLLMSVFPGFGGQGFIEQSYSRLTELRHAINASASDAYLAIDGGVKIDNIGKIVRHGADFCVMGSGLFAADDYQQQLTKIREAISAATA